MQNLAYGHCEICKRRRPTTALGAAFCVDGKGRDIIRCNDNERCTHVAKIRAVQSRPVVEKSAHTVGDLAKLTDRAKRAHDVAKDAADQQRGSDGET